MYCWCSESEKSWEVVDGSLNGDALVFKDGTVLVVLDWDRIFTILVSGPNEEQVVTDWHNYVNELYEDVEDPCDLFYTKTKAKFLQGFKKWRKRKCTS